MIFDYGAPFRITEADEARSRRELAEIEQETETPVDPAQRKENEQMETKKTSQDKYWSELTISERARYVASRPDEAVAEYKTKLISMREADALAVAINAAKIADLTKTQAMLKSFQLRRN
jgi:hypothetical protein